MTTIPEPELEMSGAELVAEHKGDWRAFYADPLVSDEQRAGAIPAESEETS